MHIFGEGPKSMLLRSTESILVHYISTKTVEKRDIFGTRIINVGCNRIHLPTYCLWCVLPLISVIWYIFYFIMTFFRFPSFCFKYLLVDLFSLVKVFSVLPGIYHSDILMYEVNMNVMCHTHIPKTDQRQIKQTLDVTNPTHKSPRQNKH